MSEQFDAGLRDLYAAAEMAHDARPGLAVGAMIARTRRTRRTRVAAVTLATAAAVVGVAVAGTAVVSNLDATPAPPADGPTATDAPDDAVTDPAAALACGSLLGDVATVPPDAGLTLSMGLETPELSAGDLLAWLGTSTGDGAAADQATQNWLPAEGGGIPAGYGFVVTQDGVVVGTTLASLSEVDAPDGDPRTHEARLAAVGCDGRALAPGAYELVAYLPLQLETGPDAWTPATLLSGPVAFTVPDAGPLPPADAHYLPDGASAVPPSDPAAPLPDGSYLAHVSDIDAAAGTVSADVVVLYFGSAAEEWVAANAPGTEILDDYVSDDPDGQTDRVIPLATDTPVWEVCWGPNEQKVRRTGGVAEWATAPIEDGESLCSDTSTIPVGGLYWLDVRGGVIAQVVGQFVP
ncbi:hypothetical protein [Actinotalea fermentans]|uniref:Uncharacterized protein n=1 Tax=Actinotalea fermentans TaxID=43671 RepID=A0A511YY29_9CELL|nr:hypothetical protein [Actinotalea fermentans]KGM15552.1 hypothetical protein N867_07535 [Actinotalea fermentans ATCC 43279 = JCM 9966 = DSM 3133]GEN80101.1 hypothetical protein AFE02nite_18350 [Actinotalea fermentans]